MAKNWGLGGARGSGGLASEAPGGLFRGTTVWVLASARAGVEGCHSSTHPRGRAKQFRKVSGYLVATGTHIPNASCSRTLTIA